MEISLAEKFDPVSTSCALCGSPDIALHHVDFHGIRIFKCARCGVQFMNPVYSDRHLQTYYAQYTQEDRLDQESEYYCNDYYLSLVERFTKGKGRLFDIGTGAGIMLKAAQDRGWFVTGYDVDPRTTETISKKLGVEILSGDFTKIPAAADSCQAIVMHHVLEHLKSPGPYLEKICSMLCSGGILFIVIPNIGSLSSRFKFVLEKLGIRRKKVGSYYDTPHHLWYYTPQTLERLLKPYGFEILEMRSGHQARPRQSHLQRLLMRHVTERFLWKSTFLVVARNAK